MKDRKARRKALVFLAVAGAKCWLREAHFLITAVIQPGMMLAAFSGRMRRPGA